MINIEINKILEQYYSLEEVNIVNQNGTCIVTDRNNIQYNLYKTNKFQKVMDAYEILFNNNFEYYFVLNKYNAYYTYVEKIYYVLILAKNKNIDINKIINPQEAKIIKKIDWIRIWIEECDSIEKKYFQIKGKYRLIDESIHYYLNMMEIAIAYLNRYKSYYDKTYVQHKKMNKKEYLNPFNFILDYKERDIAEYFKYVFFNDDGGEENYSNKKSDSKKIEEVIKKYMDDNMINFNYDLIIARLLLPNYYFYLVDEIILNKQDQKVLNKVLCKKKEYEEVLKEIIIKRNNKNKNSVKCSKK